MALTQPELGRVLACDDALAGRDEPGENVQERRLAGAGASRNDDVQPRRDCRVEILDDRLRRAACGDDLLRRENLAPELADGEARPVDRARWDAPVAARSVLQPRVPHRLRLVDAPADRGYDAVDHATQASLVLEGKVCELDAAPPLDEDLLRPVDHDLGDVRVAQRRL